MAFGHKLKPTSPAPFPPTYPGRSAIQSERMTHMQRLALTALVAMSLVMLSDQASTASDDAKPLEGVWVGQSMEADGKAVPAEAAKRMRLTFNGDMLLFRGNFDNDREAECTYKLDVKPSPKHFEFTPPNEKKPILGIFEVNGNELKICMRHARSDKGRPSEFATKEGSQLILLVLRKQEP
jgi:uncharacterized protein (TIGR03067 family)